MVGVKVEVDWVVEGWVMVVEDLVVVVLVMAEVERVVEVLVEAG